MMEFKNSILQFFLVNSPCWHVEKDTKMTFFKNYFRFPNAHMKKIPFYFKKTSLYQVQQENKTWKIKKCRSYSIPTPEFSILENRKKWLLPSMFLSQRFLGERHFFFTSFFLPRLLRKFEKFKLSLRKWSIFHSLPFCFDSYISFEKKNKNMEKCFFKLPIVLRHVYIGC